MSWLKRARKGIRLLKPNENGETPARREVPENLWNKCPDCGDLVYHKELASNLWVCYQCGYHFPISTERYLELLLDADSFEETHRGLVSQDPLGFKDTKKYRDRLRDTRAKTGKEDAVITGFGRVHGIPLALSVMDFSFMGGSMGSVVGEKIARCIKDGIDRRVPVLVVSRSGGARMQESILSLMQMAKTASMLARLGDAGLPYISLLTHPTTGGVTASYAMLGDVILAEPKALVGFAGPRVIKQTINAELPEGFQMSEFLQEHGMVDRIVARRDLKRELRDVLLFLWKDAAEHSREDADAAGAVPTTL